MDLKQARVTHKAFGDGVVTQQTDSTLSVRFEALDAEKKFAFPEAFEQFLTCGDSDQQAAVNKALSEAKRRRAHAAAELNRERTARQARLVEEMHTSAGARTTTRKKASLKAGAQKKPSAKKKPASKKEEKAE